MSIPRGYGRCRHRLSVLVRWSRGRDRWLLVAVRRTAVGVDRELRRFARDEFGGTPWRLIGARGFGCDVVRTVGQLLPPGYEPVIWATLRPELLR